MSSKVVTIVQVVNDCYTPTFPYLDGNMYCADYRLHCHRIQHYFHSYNIMCIYMSIENHGNKCIIISLNDYSDVEMLS